MDSSATAAPKKVLFYGPTSGGYAATTPGIEATVWDRDTWLSKWAVSDSQGFDAIVFGDQPICFGNESVWDAAITNRGIWSAAVTGNVIVNGTDPDFHAKERFVHQSVAFAAADDKPGPGLYASLSYAYHSSFGVAASLLWKIGDFRVKGVQSCPGDAHKVAIHPTLDGLDDAYLSNWSCSAHEIFTQWPGDFVPLVIIRDAEPSPPEDPWTAPDGTKGHPYVLARGAVQPCEPGGDADGDCIPDDVERIIKTDPNNPDTDGDGLLDSWEVSPEGVPGAGILLPSGTRVDRDAVFGPYATPGTTSAGCGPTAPALRRHRQVL